MRWRRPLAGVLALVLAVAAVGVTTGAGTSSDHGGYRVRAIFDNASFVIPGEDVKVAGVKAGRVLSLSVTRDHKAAVTFEITEPAFRPFRSDATCSVGLQSLIGEQFVECEPTARRGDAVPARPELGRIVSGPGRGAHALPVTQTSSPVGVDLIGDIQRVPQRERLRLIINEFGTGLAGNGTELRAAIARADPALREADALVATLAQQNRTLARLTDESDRVLGPLARRRESLGRTIDTAGRTGVAVAQRGDALESDLRQFPAFLRQLKPAAARLDGLARQMGPAVATLAARAPEVNDSVARLGPFARAATPAITSLGRVAARGRRTFPRIDGVVTRLRELASPLRPLAANLAALSSSFDRAGGVESLMRFIYFYTGTVNGEDRLGHFIRSGFSASGCAQRLGSLADASGSGCASNFVPSASATRAAPADAGDGLLDYLLGDGTARP